MPSRMPIGCTFWPISVLFRFRYSHCDMTHALYNPVWPTSRSWSQTFQGRSLIYIHRWNFQLINISTIIVLSIGNGRFKQLFDNDCAFLLLNVSTFMARSTDKPLIWSATKRIFCGDVRAYFNVAVVDMLNLSSITCSFYPLHGPWMFSLPKIHPACARPYFL